MSKRIVLAFAILALCVAGVAVGQEMILDMVANKVIGKYQSASCEELWVKKSQPQSAEEQRAVQFPAQRFDGSHCLPQQGGRADREQDVRVRDDPLSGAR